MLRCLFDAQQTVYITTRSLLKAVNGHPENLGRSGRLSIVVVHWSSRGGIPAHSLKLWGTSQFH